jgi:hypothetical protein
MPAMVWKFVIKAASVKPVRPWFARPAISVTSLVFATQPLGSARTLSSLMGHHVSMGMRVHKTIFVLQVHALEQTPSVVLLPHRAKFSLFATRRPARAPQRLTVLFVEMESSMQGRSVTMGMY